MVDSLAERPQTSRISPVNNANKKKSNRLQKAKIKNMYTPGIPTCFIKLRRINLPPNINNNKCNVSNTTASSTRVVSAIVRQERGICTKTNRKAALSLAPKQKRKIKAETNEDPQNMPSSSKMPETQKGCKKLVVMVKRLAPKLNARSDKKDLQQQCTLNESLSRPNTRNIRISYKPKEYKPKCACACAQALQVQCAFNNTTQRPGVNTKEQTNTTETTVAATAITSTRKPIVRLKRINLQTITTATKDTLNEDLEQTNIETAKTPGKRNLKKGGGKVMVESKPNPRTRISKNANILQRVVNATDALNITRFSPVRNSTVFGVCEKSFSEEGHDEKFQSTPTDIKNNSASKDSGVKQKSLTNRPDVIEQILFSEEESEDEQAVFNNKENCENNNSKTNDRARAHKFFHRETVKRRQSKKRQSKKATNESENIFEFLSQSDTSETENGKKNDPAADIINKLISEGKVRVATNHKGTGRPILKRVFKKKDVKGKKANKAGNKIKKAGDGTKHMKGINEDANNNAQSALSPVPLSVAHGEEQDTNAHFDDANQQYANDGGFSRLARSVMLQQTRKYEVTHRKNIDEQRRLLEFVRKVVSTPAPNRKNESIPDLSPIQAPSVQRRPVCPSPWRIDEDSHLPRVFNFSKNNSYLPTFSSDYIPPSPKKANSKISTDTHVPADASSSLANNINLECSSDQSQDLNRSTNNSNEENMPPPPATTSVLHSDENADIFNMREMPNPRRILPHRSPLKAINILEVVHLPPWKKSTNANDAENSKSNISDNSICTTTNANDAEYSKSNISDNSHRTTTNANDAENSKSNISDNSNFTTSSKQSEATHSIDDLFGFDELLDHDSDESEHDDANDLPTTSKRQSIKQKLHKKLKNLEKWRPKNTIHYKPKPSGPMKTAHLFDEGRPKQRLINEMLCSTMINHKQHADPEAHIPERNIENDSSSDAEDKNIVTPDEPDFFNEYEPETTLKEKQPRRTYARRDKRKRKARKNAVRFLCDSEESNSDSDYEQHEAATKKEEQKKRRHEAHAKPKENAELDSFVNEFNSMCKEVENYELIVE